jgi:Mg2+ and Co2+ transporter CorA
MAAKTNFDDNIFFVNTIVKTLKAGISLDIDPEYFREKMVEDILFVDSSLSRIYAALKENEHLIKRAEYLRNLARAKRIYADFLTDVLEGNLTFSANLDGYFSKFRASRSENLADVQEIHHLLDRPGHPEAEQEDIISHEEYKYLLEDDEQAAEE